jgi:hypothetical protein
LHHHIFLLFHHPKIGLYSKSRPPCPPFLKGSCEKIDLVLFHVIPAKAGIQCFQSITNLLAPGACPGLDPGFTGVTAEKHFFHTIRGVGRISETVRQHTISWQLSRFSIRVYRIYPLSGFPSTEKFVNEKLEKILNLRKMTEARMEKT